MRYPDRARLLALLALAIATSCLAACSGAGSAASSDAPATPAAGGTLTFAIPYGPDCLDPQEGQGGANFLARPLLDSLVWEDSGGHFHPWLATSWSISADQKTYTFHLRTGVTFSDGEPFDAAAVKANLDHVVAPSTKSEQAASLIASYDYATVINPTTVAVMLKAPDSSFLSALATSDLGMEAPDTLKLGSTVLCSKIVGTGPFVSTGGFVSGRGITYTRRAGYDWAPQGIGHQGPAYLDAIKIEVVPDDSTRAGALTSGQVDAADAIAPVDVSEVKAASGYAVETVPTPGVNYSYTPNTQHGPLSDIRVREALRVGIDYALIVKKLFFGVYSAATGPLASTTPGYDPSPASDYTYDPALAARLLDEAGWTGRDAAGYRTRDGVPLTLSFLYIPEYYEEYQTLGTQIQAAAAQIGIKINYVSLGIGSYTQRVLAGDYDLLNVWGSSDTPDVLRQYFDSAFIPVTQINSNASRYSNPEVDSWFAQALATTSQQRQDQLYAKAQQQITADAAVIPIYQQTYVLGLSDKVHGLTFETQTYPTFYDAWLAP